MVISKIRLPVKFDQKEEIGKESVVCVNGTHVGEIYIPTGITMPLNFIFFKYKIIERYSDCFIERFVITFEPWEHFSQKIHIFPVMIKIYDINSYSPTILCLKGIKRIYEIFNNKLDAKITSETELMDCCSIYEMINEDVQCASHLKELNDLNIYNDQFINERTFKSYLNNIVSDLYDTWQAVKRNRISIGYLNDIYCQYFEPYFGEHRLDNITLASNEGCLENKLFKREYVNDFYPDFINPIESIKFENVTIKNDLNNKHINDIYEIFINAPITDIKLRYILPIQFNKVNHFIKSNAIVDYVYNRFGFNTIVISEFINKLTEKVIALINDYETDDGRKICKIKEIEIIKNWHEEILIKIKVQEGNDIDYYIDMVLAAITSKQIINVDIDINKFKSHITNIGRTINGEF